jgi:hypothetical protein
VKPILPYLDASALGGLPAIIDEVVLEAIVSGLAPEEMFVLAFEGKGVALQTRQRMGDEYLGASSGFGLLVSRLLELPIRRGCVLVLAFPISGLFIAGHLEVQPDAGITSRKVGSA